MISIARGEEPDELKRERNCSLARAILARQQGVRLEDFSGYEVVKATLAHRVGYKCVYCEKGLRPEGSPVEHFRPKAKVVNQGEPEDPERYWWLAWTWGNLLFACFRCNTEYKKNQFPRRPGTPLLQAMCFDVSVEQPLLIDPSRVDPRKHIRFKWSESRNRWIPCPVEGSALGNETIIRLGLDEDDAADRYVETCVMPLIRVIKGAAVSGSPGGVDSGWCAAMSVLFSPNSEFQALSWDVLDHYFPVAWRQGHGVELPTIGRLEPVPLDVAFHDPEEMAHLSEDLRLRIRALGARAPEKESSRLLEEVLAVRDWRDEELARLFGREVLTIRRWRSALSQR